MRSNKISRWAIVLSGGGAKGIAHAGFLKALQEMGAPEPSLIVGTSMGSIVGGLYACGMSVDELIDFVTVDFEIHSYLDGVVFPIRGPLARIVQTGQAISNLATRPGIDSGRKILAVFEKLSQGKTFAQTRIPFRCNAVDLVSGKEIVFESGSVARAMRASMSFPAFFDPLVEGDMRLADGGIVNNLPVRIARNMGYKRILAVDVSSFRALPASGLKTGPGVIYRSLEVAITHVQKGDADTATLTIEAHDSTSPFEFEKAAHLVDLGKKAAYAKRRELEAFFEPGALAALGRAMGRSTLIDMQGPNE
ncbi:patatin-like phospholipase family protein [Treponema sp.]